MKIEFERDEIGIIPDEDLCTPIINEGMTLKEGSVDHTVNSFVNNVTDEKVVSKFNSMPKKEQEDIELYLAIKKIESKIYSPDDLDFVIEGLDNVEGKFLTAIGNLADELNITSISKRDIWLSDNEMIKKFKDENYDFAEMKEELQKEINKLSEKAEENKDEQDAYCDRKEDLKSMYDFMGPTTDKEILDCLEIDKQERVIPDLNDTEASYVYGDFKKVVARSIDSAIDMNVVNYLMTSNNWKDVSPSFKDDISNIILNEQEKATQDEVKMSNK